MSDTPRCYGIIPARFASSRFPGKPLAAIHGKPMLWHVYTRACRCPELSSVTLATDDERIAARCRDLDVPVVMTSASHASGTDRVFEAAVRLGVPEDAVVVNIQGDEPALDPCMLSELLAPFADPGVRVATLARTITAEEAAGPDVVKVVRARDGRALYFSRAPIPHTRDASGNTVDEETFHLGHIGLYAFRMEALRAFTKLTPGELERREKLEQLRLLENGIDIHVARTECVCLGVDRPEDLKTVERMLERDNAGTTGA